MTAPSRALSAIIDKKPRLGCVHTATLHMIQRGFYTGIFHSGGFGIGGRGTPKNHRRHFFGFRGRQQRRRVAP